MTFLNPGLLAAGLACVAIPIIIHLLMHRRRKPVVWGAMRFLLEAYRRQQRRLMVEKWLLLLVRCLVVGLIAAAIGKPLIGGILGGTRGRTVFVLVDNSLTASARDPVTGESALDRHKRSAKAVLEQLRGTRSGEQSHRAALITLAGPAEGVVLPLSRDVASVAALVDGIVAADSKADFTGGLALVSGAMSGIGQGSGVEAAGLGGRAAEVIDPRLTDVVIVSDFREGSLKLGQVEGGIEASVGAGLKSGIRLPAGVRIIATPPASEGLGNIGVVSAEPARGVLVSGADTQGGQFVRVQLRRDSPRAEGVLLQDKSGEASGAGVLTRVRAKLIRLDGAGAAAAKPTGAATGNGGGDVVRWSPGQESAVAIVPLTSEGALGASGTGSAGGVGGARGESSTQIVSVSIDDDSIGGDNVLRRPIELRESLRVGIVAPTRFGKSASADQLDAASWIRLALNPISLKGGAGGSGAGGGGAAGGGLGIEIVGIEPAAVDAPRLSGLDAVVLPEPEKLTEQSWQRVRTFAEGGGLVVISPPAGVTVHLWGDVMSRGLGTDWSVAREARVFEQGSTGAGLRRSGLGAGTLPAAGSGALAGGGAAGGKLGAEGLGAGGTRASGAAGLLSQIDGELDELARGVRVSRVVPMSGGGAVGAGGGGGGVGVVGGNGGDSGAVLLELGDGTPVLTVLSLERSTARSANAQAPGVGGVAVAGAGGSEAGGLRGLVVYLAVAPELSWTDLPARPLMVPLMQELIRQGVGQARGSWVSVAGERVRVPARTAELRPVGPLGAPSAQRAEAKSAVRVEGGVAGVIRSAGVYRAVDEGGVVRGVVSVVADPRAGEGKAQGRDVVGAWLESVVMRSGAGRGDGAAGAAAGPGGSMSSTGNGEGASALVWLDGGLGTSSKDAGQANSGSGALTAGGLFSSGSRGSPMWWAALWGALALVVLEIVLARWASHASMGVSSPSMGKRVRSGRARGETAA